MDPITAKTHAWAAAKVGITPEEVANVEFTTIDAGYCETCSYTTCGVEITTKTGGWSTHTLNYENMADIVREILATEVTA